jgi:hypothetical protein
MRAVLTVLIGAVCLGAAMAQTEKEPAPDRRQGIVPDLKTYPQGTPQEALASVLKAIDNKRIDYLLAQLSDPEWVEQRLKDTDGKFTDLVQETTKRLVDDPGPGRQLNRFAKDGEWEVGDSTASVKLKDVKDRIVYVRKIKDRWFLENRSRPDSDKK